MPVCFYETLRRIVIRDQGISLAQIPNPNKVFHPQFCGVRENDDVFHRFEYRGVDSCLYDRAAVESAVAPNAGDPYKPPLVSEIGESSSPQKCP